ncbi:uncharacterized protein LOC133037239 [Cannabis sativa]|uniref:uncharacterized protein LOC133037239 n=1 Tax=Cannabis sativa TaxID=3483 RepID=UPI0029C9DAE8|nr:uncharacterized protein LOC133037239 [Cannabis sativa]
MTIIHSLSSPSPLPKKKLKMGVKSVANKSKGKHPVVEDDDYDFALPVLKRDRGPAKKKYKIFRKEKLLSFTTALLLRHPMILMTLILMMLMLMLMMMKKDYQNQRILKLSLGEDRGDGYVDDDVFDDKVGADAFAIGVVQGDVVVGSEGDTSKDVDSVKGKEFDIKGDDFFQGHKPA